VGTVIAAEPVLREPASLRPALALHRALICLEVLAIPVVAALWFLSAGRILPLLALLGIGFVVLRFLRPGSLLGMIGMSRLLSPQRGGDVTVRQYRLRTVQREEVAARATGELRGAHLMPGDEIEAWGRWRWGVLHLRSMANLRTGARTSFRAQGSWAPLLVHLVILALGFAVLLPAWGRLFGGGR
jgi:hypothetical protein